jgi:hypothetical protein
VAHQADKVDDQQLLLVVVLLVVLELVHQEHIEAAQAEVHGGKFIIKIP